MNKKVLSVLTAVLFSSSFALNLINPSSANAATTTTATTTTNAYNWNNARIVGGGFIPGIIYNTKEKDLKYIRTDMGGAYRWDTTNNKWIPLTDWVGFDDWNSLGCESLATDPVDPDRVYIAAGTYTNDWTTQNGKILRSSDRGKTWQSTTLPIKLGGNMPGRSMGERLVIDPNNNNILYLGTRSGNGLWKSTDAGVTWAKVSSFTAVGNYSDDYFKDQIGVVWVTFDSTSAKGTSGSQTIYVGVADTNNTIYKSTDGGATWAAVEGQPKAGYFPHHGVLASNGMLYVTYSNTCGPYDGNKGDVWKYNTKTGAWTNISPVASTNEDDYYGYGGLAVDAQNPNTLVVTTLNSWWPDANIYRSTDGGATWTSLWSWNGYPTKTMRYTQDISLSPWLSWGTTPAFPETNPKLGWMIGDIDINPFNSDEMLYGTGATLYGTDNLTNLDKGGKITISVKADGIEETAVNSLVSLPSGAHLLSGLGDVSGFKYDDDLTKVPAKMFSTPTFSTTSCIDYAESNPNYVVRVGSTDKKVQCFASSNDGGSNWNPGNSDITGSEGGGSVAVSANGNTVVWSPTGAKATVGYSTTNGNSWTSCAGIPAGAKVYSDRVNSKKFYGFLNGIFYISTDGGATFTKTTATGLPTTGTGNFKAVPGTEGDIWLTGGSDKEGVYGLWHSTNSGATFTKLANVDKADVIGFGKAATGKTNMALYTSAQINGVRGIFRSDDYGTTWVRINDDAHQYGCTNTAITGDPRIFGRVYIATNGRGIIYGDPVNSTEPTEPTNPPTTIKDSTISPISASFDLANDKQADIQTTTTFNGNTLSSISNGSTILTRGTDYTVVNSTVTILKSYLSKQSVGSQNLSFKFSAGNDCTLGITIKNSDSVPTPTPDPTPVQSSTLTLQTFNSTTSASTTKLDPKFRLTNCSTSAIDLSKVKIRYYYTVDSDVNQTFWCNWSSVGSTNVIGTFNKLSTSKTNSDSYLEISFSSSAGMLQANGSIDIQTMFAKNNWSNYTQTNDYSFNSSASFVDFTKCPVYYDNTLVCGVEP